MEENKVQNEELEEVPENILTEEQKAQIEEYQNMYKKMHTPWKRRYKIGRNDPCPCGSGKKYKNCCRLKEEDLPIYTVNY